MQQVPGATDFLISSFSDSKLSEIKATTVKFLLYVCHQICMLESTNKQTHDLNFALNFCLPFAKAPETQQRTASVTRDMIVKCDC